MTSWQLYAEAAMPASTQWHPRSVQRNRIRRHLTEFWHAEMEIAGLQMTMLWSMAKAWFCTSHC